MIHLITPAPLTLSTQDKVLLQLLSAYPHAHTAYFDANTNGHEITLETHEPNLLQPNSALTLLGPIKLNWKTAHPPKNLLLPLPSAQALTGNSQCYPAPIPLGCQIQPHGKNWIGTAGGPIAFRDPLGQRYWGFITNAHVTGIPTNPDERKIHQPNVTKPHIGYTKIHCYPTPNRPNLLDFALIDTRVDGHHKTHWQILEIGRIAEHWSNATPQTPVMKYGRTTLLTRGWTVQTGVAAKIDYGTFIATFIDLDMIKSDDPPFSQPGDSGSLIVNAKTKSPVALLFAGSPTTTLAIPLRNVAKHVTISFKP